MKTLDASLVTFLLFVAPLSSAWSQSLCVKNVHSIQRHSTTRVFSTPRKPRRDMQKRRRRQEKQEQTQSIFQADESVWNTGEVRPLVKESAKEKGLDYWIPQDELVKYQEIEEAKRLRDPGQVSNEKLMTEVLSPYRQNWIGLISVSIVVIATLIKNFPELLNSPDISFPDL